MSDGFLAVITIFPQDVKLGGGHGVRTGNLLNKQDGSILAFLYAFMQPHRATGVAPDCGVLLIIAPALFKYSLTVLDRQLSVLTEL